MGFGVWTWNVKIPIDNQMGFDFEFILLGLELRIEWYRMMLLSINKDVVTYKR